MGCDEGIRFMQIPANEVKQAMMQSINNPSKRTRNRLLAATAAVAVSAAVGFGAVTSGSGPVFADPVRVEAPQAPSFADVVEKVSPAVVSVRVQSKVEPASFRGEGFGFGMQDMPGFDDLPDDHPLKRFFREFRGDRPDGNRRGGRGGPRPMAQGSGFFISEDGYLVTNNHVISGGNSYSVVMDDGTEIDARLVGSDPRTDLAVLKVDEEREFTYVAFEEDNKVRVGDWVVAVGNPFGLGGTVTAGIVSARGRDIGAGPYDDFIQIDAAVNRGNSGGPAFNLNGEVVGVNTAIFSPSGGNVGIAFAIPASVAQNVVEELIETGSVERGWLGVQIQPVTEDIAESLGLAAAEGALVSEPQADSPAAEAGVRAGDVIVSVDGETVESPRELARKIGNMNPGETVEVAVWRGGEEQSVEITLGELPGIDRLAAAGEDRPGDIAPGALEDFGLTVTPAEDGPGLVVTDVAVGSTAEERGIQAGDVILSINTRDVSNADDIAAAIDEATEAGRKAVLVRIERDETTRFVALPVGQG